MTFADILSEWWRSPGLSFIEKHPVAHAAGGVVFYAAGRALWWAAQTPPNRWHAWAFAALAQTAWEAVQVEVTPGYSWARFGALDAVFAAVVAAAVASLAI